MGYVINFEPLFYNGNQMTVGFGEEPSFKIIIIYIERMIIQKKARYTK